MGLADAKRALARGDDHRAAGKRASAKAAYFEAASKAKSSTPGETQETTDVIMRARIGLGRVALMKRSPERAHGWFLDAQQVAPDAWEPLYWLGCAQGWLGDSLGAERSFTAALELNSPRHSVAIQRAYARLKGGSLDAARDDLLTAQRAGGLDDTAILVLASLRFERDEWGEGERILKALLDRDPANMKANLLMGIALERQWRQEESIEWYERAADQGEESARTRLGVLHARAGRAERALSWLQQARLARRPDDETLAAYGWASFKMGLFQDSVDAWEELQRRRPSRQAGVLLAAAKHELARELIGAEDYEAALPLLETCVDLGIGGPGTVRALDEVRVRLIAQDVAKRGQSAHPSVKAQLATASRRLTDDAPLAFFRGLLEWADGSIETAQPQLRSASDLGGLSRRARLAIVRCALEAGDRGGAERELLRLDDQQGGGNIRDLAHCLGEGRWSDAADLLLAPDAGDLREELLAHCLVLANRSSEVDVSTPRGARAGLVGGLTSAAGGALDTAGALLRRVLDAHPNLQPPRAALSSVDRLRAFRAVEEGSWGEAAALFTRASSTGPPPPAACLLEGLAFLMAGREPQAAASLTEALRQDPSDNRVLHAISALWLGDEHASVDLEVAIAAFAALLHDETFWERFRAGASLRYQVTVSAHALTECRRTVQQRAQARAGSASELLLLREMAAAEALRDLGGFPVYEARLVCGPLMIRFLEAETAFGDFASHKGPPSSQWQRLQQLFSGLGPAVALLDAERPEEALAALEAVACDRCRLEVEPGVNPPVCQGGCPDFRILHPGYGSLPDRGRRLAEDAARLAVAARLGAARRLVATNLDEVRAATRLWKDAARLSAAAGEAEQVQRQIVDTVLGRAKVLESKGLLSEAIALLERAEPTLRDFPARDELRSRLAELLTDRGVRAGNDERWHDALDDLRRAVRRNPHATRPILNQSIVLQRLAEAESDPAARRELLREAERIVEIGLAEASASPELEQQLASVRKGLHSLYEEWAIGLAADTRYEEALEVLGEGLGDFPADARLEEIQKTVNPYADPAGSGDR